VFRRTYLGLDVTTAELRCVALRRKGRSVQLTGGRLLTLPAGLLRPSFREPNITALRPFSEALHEVLDPLAGREERLALILPEACGRIVLTETEGAFRTRQEGAEILKWQLRKTLPAEVRDLRLDFQVLERRENGRCRVAVSLMAAPVLDQYQEVLAANGYAPEVIDFHSLNLYNYYRPRLDLGDDFTLVGVEGGTLSVQFFQGRSLTFHRVRQIDSTPVAAFQELNRSLAGCQEFPAFRRAAVFLHSDWTPVATLSEMLASVFERDISLLQPQLHRLIDANTNVWRSPPAAALTAAVGGAERMMS
jgi:type IV pilus assembly protein PilM